MAPATLLVEVVVSIWAAVGAAVVAAVATLVAFLYPLSSPGKGAPRSLKNSLGWALLALADGIAAIGRAILGSEGA